MANPIMDAERADRREDGAAQADRPRVPGAPYWGLLRISLGWIFLWAFLDRLLALGFSTGRDAETGEIDFLGSEAWINGGSPTEGFLRFGLNTAGFLEDFYSSLAGLWWVDAVYMVSMLAIGLALMLGVLTRLAAFAGIAWMALFYTASSIWPENNPFLTYHIVYAIALAGIASVGAGRFLGLGKRWERLPVVRRHAVLR